MQSGLYIVTLNNVEPISVNADRPKIADKCIKVNFENCKLGRAKDFATRRKDYFRTFGSENVNFYPIVGMDDFKLAEKIAMPFQDEFRMRGRTGRKNEWLAGTDPFSVFGSTLFALELASVQQPLSFDLLMTVPEAEAAFGMQHYA